MRNRKQTARKGLEDWKKQEANCPKGTRGFEKQEANHSKGTRGSKLLEKGLEDLRNRKQSRD